MTTTITNDEDRILRIQEASDGWVAVQLIVIRNGEPKLTVIRMTLLELRGLALARAPGGTKND